MMDVMLTSCDADNYSGNVTPPMDSDDLSGTVTPLMDSARRTADEMKRLGYTAEQCRDAGFTVPELIRLCHCPWERGEGKGSWRGFQGRAVIAEGKFGHITDVRAGASEDIKVKYADEGTNAVNTSGGFDSPFNSPLHSIDLCTEVHCSIYCMHSLKPVRPIEQVPCDRLD